MRQLYGVPTELPKLINSLKSASFPEVSAGCDSITGMEMAARRSITVSAGCPSLRNPDRSGSEQMINDSYLVREEQTKAETQQA